MEDYGFWRVVLGVIGVLLIPLFGVVAKLSAKSGRTDQTVETQGGQIEKIDGECGVCRREVHGRIDTLVGEVGEVKEMVAEIRGWLKRNGLAGK